MPDPLRHLSNFAEEAVGDIRLVTHEYVAARAVSPGSATAGRFGGMGLGFGDRATQLAIANIVSVVEHYAEQVLLTAGCTPRSIRSWPDMVKQWSKKFGADVETTCPSFPSMRGFYEARTAIMHRRGELTDTQRTQQVYERLADADVGRIGFELIVSERTVRRCSEVCVGCVEELDATTTLP